MSRSDGRPVLSPSGIGQYIAFSECPRYLKLRFDDQGEEAGREWNEAFKPLSVLLSGTGESFEDETREAIEQHATESIHAKEEWEFSYDLDEEFPQALDASQAGFEQTLTEVATLEGDDGPLLLYEAPLCGRIGVWPIGGRADVVALWPAEDGTVRVHVLEIKASWKPKAYHQIQAGIYTLLLREIFHDLDVDYKISAGVIHREVNTADFARENLPSFDLEPREADVKRLLAEDAKIDRVLTKDLEDVRFQLNAKCNDCIFNESCFTRAVEGKKTALLGLTIGEQKALEQHGVETIEQVACLKEVPENPVPWEYHNINPRDGQQELVEQLLNEPAIGGKLDEIIQRAQSMLGEVHPDHENAREEPYAPSFVGAGRSTLPDDDPPDWDSIAYSAGELIQVYLHVEWDYMRDRIVMLSARINCDDFPASALKFSEITESLPDDSDESMEVEKDLLTTFFEKLFRGIQEVAEITGNPETAPIHLYLFSSLERDRLMDAIRRHPEFTGADMSERPHPVRDLLGLRTAIDQPMVSIIQDEIDDRFALKFPSTGLLPALEQFVDGDGVGWWNYPEWDVEKEDGTEINLRRVFYHNFFNNESPYTLEGDGSIRLLLERGAYQSPEQEGFYPLRARFGNQIPLEYIWAAKDKLDTGWASEEQRQERRAIEKYKWHDRQEKTHRISEEELNLLGEKLCHAIEHIESGLIGKNAQLGKAPIEIPRLDTFTLGETNLARACREYLDLEYYSNRQEMLRHYAISPKQRVQTGRSAIVRVESTERTAEGLQVEGHLLYDELGFSSPQQVANSCRLKGSEGATSGSWMVATALERDDNGMFTEVDHATPEDIEKSVPTKVEAIDTPDRSITLKFSNFFNENEGHGQYLDRAYEVQHNSWTEDSEEEGEYTEYIMKGGGYIFLTSKPMT